MRLERYPPRALIDASLRPLHRDRLFGRKDAYIKPDGAAYLYGRSGFGSRRGAAAVEPARVTGHDAASPNGWSSCLPKSSGRLWESITGFRSRCGILKSTTCHMTGRHSSTTSNTIGQPTRTSSTWISYATAPWVTELPAPATRAGGGLQKKGPAQPSRCSISMCRDRWPSPPTLASLGCVISAQQLNGRVHFWPFDGGVPPSDRHVIVEAYPSPRGIEPANRKRRAGEAKGMARCRRRRMENRSQSATRCRRLRSWRHGPPCPSPTLVF